MSRLQDIERDDEQSPPPPPLVSGKWVILTVLGIGIFGAVFGWLYQYDAKRQPKDFWGPVSWKLFAEAPNVTAILLTPEPPDANNKAWDQNPDTGELNVLIVTYEDDPLPMRFVVTERKAAARTPGLSMPDNSTSLREALQYYKSYDFEKQKFATAQKPNWRYALRFFHDPKPDIEGRPQLNPDTILLFDGQCRWVRLLMVDKPIQLRPPISEQFRKFFLSLYPDSAPAGMPDTLPLPTAPQDNSPVVGGPASTVVQTGQGPMISSFDSMTTTQGSPAATTIPNPRATPTPAPSATPRPSPGPTPSATSPPSASAASSEP